MEQDELQRIRAARLAELQAQHSTQSSTGRSSHATHSLPGQAGPGGQGGQGGEDKAEADAAQRHGMLSQILDSSARDRLRRIALVKADRARAIEDLVLDMARRGQIRQRVSEQELVGLLEEISGREQDNEANGHGGGSGSRGKITFQRRRDSFDDEWD